MIRGLDTIKYVLRWGMRVGRSNHHQDKVKHLYKNRKWYLKNAQKGAKSIIIQE